MECPHFGYGFHDILFPFQRARIHPSDSLTFYKTCVRPVMVYARPVFHDYHLPMGRAREGTEARDVRIIYSTLSYGMRKLLDRRQDLTSKFFNDIMNNENHKLYDLFA